jgi:hypothetical protein
MNNGTAGTAKPIDPNGELYQRRALDALPLLVRQAHAGQTVFYSDLGAELGMPNARNLNFVLGAVGQSLVALGAAWGEQIPPLQALVVNRQTGIPGEGFAKDLFDPKVLQGVSSGTRKQVVKAMLAAVFAYPKWPQVLEHFRVSALPSSAVLVEKAKRVRYGGESESAAHRTLKERIAADPTLVGVTKRVVSTEVEHRLPTGDEIDVLFRTRTGVIAVEVKAHISPDDDVARGVFQCVKYEALLNAVAASEGRRDDVETILALGGVLRPDVRSLANTLGVSVLEQIDSERHDS